MSDQTPAAPSDPSREPVAGAAEPMPGGAEPTAGGAEPVESTAPASIRTIHIKRRWRVLATAALVTVAALAIASVVPLNYVIISPGPITNVIGDVKDGSKSKPLLEPVGAPRYATDGELYFTTVYEIGNPKRRPTALQLLWSTLKGTDQILPMERVFPPNVTADQVSKQEAAQMTNSQQEATAVALRKLGKPVPSYPQVQGFPDDAPNKDVLKVGDRFVSVNGTAVKTVSDVTDVIRAYPAGQDLPVVIDRKGVEKSLTLKTRSQEGRTAIGIFIGAQYDFPITVKINIENVSGPSAGLMLSLGIYDVLTPGSLPDGKSIAGTGTMSSNGGVGPIGGIRQKLIGAQNGGAEWFLAPKDNCAEVVGHIPDGLRVVKVTNFDDAVKAVEAIGSGKTDGLPSCQ